MPTSTLLAWGGFLLFVLLMLFFDLFVLHRKAHEIRFKEALIGVSVPVTVALAFVAFVYWAYNSHFLDLGILPAYVNAADPRVVKMWPTTGDNAALMYLTGYVIEISLSADNVFLFVVLMNFFRVPGAFQHRVLFWGVLGALVMRAAMILAGTVLIAKFNWIIVVFGGFLLFTGIKMLFSGEEEPDPSNSIAVRAAKKAFPITHEYHGQSFFIRNAGMLVATPLFLVLVCIEFTDLIFAVDSIPAVFAITNDPFIVFTSNVFAILGLRSMYFLLAGVMDKFHYLKIGLAVVLAFVGVKMLLPFAGEWIGQATHGHPYHWHVPIYISLTAILLTLTASVVASLLWPNPEKHSPLATPETATPPDRAFEDN